MALLPWWTFGVGHWLRAQLGLRPGASCAASSLKVTVQKPHKVTSTTFYRSKRSQGQPGPRGGEIDSISEVRSGVQRGIAGGHFCRELPQKH